ncbi:hypothetical protein ACGFZQ_39635 [Streptomyces sp. NPDC048254]|uniref:hypothetical protein n=1 Tax=Streptomyces sp. NPDC048254 TaxID=3365525 RepID=UPI0037103A48
MAESASAVIRSLRDRPLPSYSFDTEPEVTVAAGADGTASIEWTPDSAGSYGLQVYATTRSGIQLIPYAYTFTVD